MTDVVDADELLRRIRVARDWAAEREAEAGSLPGTGEGADPTAAGVDRVVFSVVREVLDEIINPGTHSRSR
ncbi:hypothetical protein ACLIYM_12790 [Streptomyces fenghuangensis]|uniref:Uncharacterized protein n=1 Tax=Streptomyces chitinivorans TaxID=1257027 RepID=A0ABW7I1I9_9ACTN|nr:MULTISPECIES: hypothetical protein [Streptomyces]MCG3039832.1 hypothetical protein [Streptomyces sp. ICN903]MDH2409400.1 hypothetical protein [Streptomyces chitinivorans]